MYVKIHEPKKYGGNTGSCENLVEYLEKENHDKEIGEGTMFFTTRGHDVSDIHVKHRIDSNHSKLCKDEAKFYMLTINPSAAELAHLSGSRAGTMEENLKTYTSLVMDEYARQFDRELNGRPMEGKDLLWYGKIETERSYRPWDKAHVRTYAHNEGIKRKIKGKRSRLSTADEKAAKGLKKEISILEKKYIRNTEGRVILPHAKKDGVNYHVHIIVSRKDRSGRLKLSPLANSRGSKNVLNGKMVRIGFDRKGFVGNCEKIFDKRFYYNRDLENSFKYYHARKHDPVKYFNYCRLLAMSPRYAAKRLILEHLLKDTHAKKILDFPHTPRLLASKMENMVISKATRTLSKMAGFSPVGVPGKAIEMALRQAVGIAKQVMVGVRAPNVGTPNVGM